MSTGLIMTFGRLTACKVLAARCSTEMQRPGYAVIVETPVSMQERAPQSSPTLTKKRSFQRMKMYGHSRNRPQLHRRALKHQELMPPVL